ncbi:MAG: hypothetical protein P1V81_16740, partial [Planctomycetota bacterium]|nr:hypothetical protein [Planctomycetota bacterium]
PPIIDPVMLLPTPEPEPAVEPSPEPPIIDPVMLLPTPEPEPAVEPSPEPPIIDPVVLLPTPEPEPAVEPSPEPSYQPATDQADSERAEPWSEPLLGQAAPWSPIPTPELRPTRPPSSVPGPRRPVRLVLFGPVLALGSNPSGAPTTTAHELVLRSAEASGGAPGLELRGMLRLALGPFGPLPLALPFLVHPNPEPALPRPGPAPARPAPPSAPAPPIAPEKEFTLSDLLNGRVEL